MATPLRKKSSVAEIEKTFNDNVERFSNLCTGQATTIDVPLAMELITHAAFASTPDIREVLDIGCGAGNSTLMLSALAGPFNCDLVDLSMPMLERARERIQSVTAGNINIFHGDFRNISLLNNKYDVIIAAAVLHHLREDSDWESIFQKIYNLTAPGGSVWITDLVWHETDSVHSLMWERYGEYLVSLDGEEFKERVFNNIDKEDSPRPVTYQLDLLKRVGFDSVELLHKNSCFAAFGAIKSKSS